MHPRGVRGVVGDAGDEVLLVAGGRAGACVGVALPEVGMQGPDLHGVVWVLGMGDGELPQWSEVGLDGVRPRGVGRGEAQPDLVLLRPATDGGASVSGQVGTGGRT